MLSLQDVENDIGSKRSSNDHHDDHYQQEDLHGHHQKDNGSGSSTTGEKEEAAAVLQRQMAVLMMANVLRLGKEISATSQNDWFKCTAKGKWTLFCINKRKHIYCFLKSRAALSLSQMALIEGTNKQCSDLRCTRGLLNLILVQQNSYTLHFTATTVF